MCRVHTVILLCPLTSCYLNVAAVRSESLALCRIHTFHLLTREAQHLKIAHKVEFGDVANTLQALLFLPLQLLYPWENFRNTLSVYCAG